MPTNLIFCDNCKKEFPAKYRIEFMTGGGSKHYDPICALVIAPENETYKLFRDRDKQEKLTDFIYDLHIPPPVPIEELRKRGMSR